MPVNKSALIRYFIIDECLSSRRKEYWPTEDLIQTFLRKGMQVTERTIRRDIYDMMYDELLGYKAPIENSRKHKGYHYTVPGFSIRNLNFTEEQVKAFDFVIRQLHEYLDLTVMQEFCGAIEKVIGVFTQLRNKELAACIQYEKAPHYEGLQHRDVILNAVLNQQIISVKYTTFKRTKAFTHVIEPYVLKEYKNWWYILGLQHHKQKPIVLALDRIDSIAVQDKTFTNKSNFESARYFDDIIGITTTDEPVQKVVLQVTQDLYKYLNKIKMHPSQLVVEENKTHVILQLQVKNNYELKSAILDHGSGVKVLEPVSLQNEIKQILIDTLKLYDNASMSSGENH